MTGKHTGSDNVCSISYLNQIQTLSGRDALLEVLHAQRDAIQTRFWSHVNKGPDCWPWTASAMDAFGHGQFTFRLRGKHYRAYAHRVSWLLSGESIPAGMVICHHCDNPPCVNPNHLFLGTQGDNLRDASRKGRLRAPRTRQLTLADRLSIYHARRDQVSGVILARYYGVSEAAISVIRKGRFVGSPEQPAHPLSPRAQHALRPAHIVNRPFEQSAADVSARGEVA